MLKHAIIKPEFFFENPTELPLAPNARLMDHAQGQSFEGKAAVAQFLNDFFIVGFRNSKSEIKSLIVNEIVGVVEFTLKGFHEKILMGLPATGRKVELPMVIVCQIKEGQIFKASLYYDAGDMLRQLGLALKQ